MITDTGEGTITLEGITDPGCSGITGPTKTELERGESASYTCQYVLAEDEAGTLHTNVASVEADKEVGMSNEVVVLVHSAAYTIEKLQTVSGEYTRANLLAKVGETVHYEIIVTNTGETPLTFSDFRDANCTNLAGGTTGPVKPHEAATWTCEHELTSEGEWVNLASVEGDEGTGAGISNAVSVKAVKPRIEVLPSRCEAPAGGYVLRGATGPKRKTFAVRVSAAGLSQITFYLDGRKLKTLNAAQAEHGEFQAKINAAWLPHGPHRVVASGVMSEPECKGFTLASVFVNPYPIRRKVVSLTG